MTILFHNTSKGT